MLRTHIGNSVTRFSEIRKRINFLLDVGLDYLALNQSVHHICGETTYSPSLLRLFNLSTCSGSTVSVGLHQRDNERLINFLWKSYAWHGETVIVVEHDEDMMRCGLDCGLKSWRKVARLFSRKACRHAQDTHSRHNTWMKRATELLKSAEKEMDHPTRQL